MKRPTVLDVLRAIGWILFSGIVCLLLFLIIAWFVLSSGDEEQAASILKLSELPVSARNFDCDDWGFTDVVAGCAFEIAPADFGALLGGWPLDSARSCRGRSAHEMSDRRLGSDFPAYECFSASPAEFEHGGFAHLITDSTRQHVLTTIYIE